MSVLVRRPEVRNGSGELSTPHRVAVGVFTDGCRSCRPGCSVAEHVARHGHASAFPWPCLWGDALGCGMFAGWGVEGPLTERQALALEQAEHQHIHRLEWEALRPPPAPVQLDLFADAVGP